MIIAKYKELARLWGDFEKRRALSWACYDHKVHKTNERESTRASSEKRESSRVERKRSFTEVVGTKALYVILVHFQNLYSLYSRVTVFKNWSKSIESDTSKPNWLVWSNFFCEKIGLVNWLKYYIFNQEITVISSIIVRIFIFHVLLNSRKKSKLMHFCIS